jgi:hypothetical protein
MPVSLGISLSNIIITVLAVVLSISIAIYSVLHRKVIGAIYMVLIALFGTSWGVLYLLELLSRTIEYKNFYDSMEYIPAIFLPSAFLLF